MQSERETPACYLPSEMNVYECILFSSLLHKGKPFKEALLTEACFSAVS